MSILSLIFLSLNYVIIILGLEGAFGKSDTVNLIMVSIAVVMIVAMTVFMF